jgi:chemotaxis protein MotA
VGLANLVFLPVANKLNALIAQQVLLREIMVEGLISIAGGEGTRLIDSRLLGYVTKQRPDAGGL